jgi:D-lactate dehydrogenase
MRTTVAVYDAKAYDRVSLTAAAGADSIDWRFFEFRLTSDSVLAAAGAQAVCIFVNDTADHAVLEKLAELGVQLLALRCTGFNHVDIEAAKALGITVTRVPIYSPHAVAEHVVALLLALNRKIHRAFNRVRELNFSLNGLVGFDLHGKTVGIVGTGKIGRIAAQIFRGFGMRVLAHDPFPDTQWAEQQGVEYVDPRALAAHSDVVSLHVPLTPDTRYLIRRETLALMKRGAIIINVSRGALINTTDLIEALKSGQLGGVGLDVYEEEEGVFFEDLSGQVLHDDELARLLTFPNVLITSHQAFLTQEALSDIARTTVANLKAVVEGRDFVEGSVLL